MTGQSPGIKKALRAFQGASESFLTVLGTGERARYHPICTPSIASSRPRFKQKPKQGLGREGNAMSADHDPARQIPAHLIAEARSQAIADVVGHRLRLTRAGRTFEALCPFHAEKTPSFKVDTKKQTFHCFGCGAHGDAIDFVMKYDGVSFREAVEAILGGGITRRTLSAAEQAAKEAELAERERQREAEDAAEIAKSRRVVKKFHTGSHLLTSAQAAPVRDYLSGRYILPGPGEKPLPDCIRYHPRVEHKDNRRAYPCLLVFAYDDQGEPVRMQAIFLEKIGGRWLRAYHQGAKLSKLTYGRGCAHLPAILPGDPTHTIEAAGPETALSVWLSSSATVSITFGDSCLGKATYSQAVEKIDFAGENDDSNRRAVESASAIYRSQGRRVGAIFPPESLKDYNDLAAAVGGDREAVRRQISAQADHHTPLRAARALYGSTIRQDIAQALAWTPESGPAPQVGSSTTPGVGKTHGSIEALGELYRAADAAGTARPVAAYALPAHVQLSDVEARAQADLCGVTCRRYIGKKQPDPRGEAGLLINGIPAQVCPKVELFERLKKAGIDAASSICGNKHMPCEYSPAAGGIGCYSKFIQSEPEKVDLWYIPTTMLFEGPPPGVEHLSLTIADEEKWVAGVDEKPREYSVDMLSFIFAEPQPPKAISAQRARLVALRENHKTAVKDHGRLREVLDALEPAFRASIAQQPGAVFMEHFKAFDPAELHYLAKKIYMYKLNFDVQPNTEYSDDDLKATREMFQRCAAISGCIEAIANALDDKHERNPYLHVVRASGDGITLSLMKKKKLHDIFANAPIIYTDATLPEKIARQFLPNLLVHEAITAPTFRFVRQTYDFAGAARNFTVWENSGDIHREQVQVKMSVRRQYRIIKAQARQFESCGEGDYDLLIVSQQKLSEKLQALGTIPRVAFAHYNNLRGIDIYKTVAKAMLIGRLHPPAQALARMASAIFNRYIEVDNYIPVEEERTDKRGRTVSLKYQRAQDEDAELLRQYICILEILQDIERGRSVLRSPDFPLHVDILTNIPLPIEVDQFISIADLDPDARDEQMLGEGVWLGSASDRVRAFPDFWQARDAKALSKTLERAQYLTQTIDIAQSRVPESNKTTSLHYRLYRSNVALIDISRVDKAISNRSVILLTDRVNLWRHRTVIVEYQLDGPRAQYRDAAFDSRQFQTADAVLSWLDRHIGQLSDARIIAAPPWWWEPAPSQVCPDLRQLSHADRAAAVRLSLAQLSPTPQPQRRLEDIDADQAPIRAAIWQAWTTTRTGESLVAAVVAAGLTLARHQGDEVVVSAAGRRFSLAHSIALHARQHGHSAPAQLARDIHARLSTVQLPDASECIPQPKPQGGGDKVTDNDIIAPCPPISVYDCDDGICYDPSIDEPWYDTQELGGLYHE